MQPEYTGSGCVLAFPGPLSGFTMTKNWRDCWFAMLHQREIGNQKDGKRRRGTYAEINGVHAIHVDAESPGQEYSGTMTAVAAAPMAATTKTERVEMIGAYIVWRGNVRDNDATQNAFLF